MEPHQNVIKGVMNTKKETYKLLTENGKSSRVNVAAQFYLPPYEDVSVDFIRDILSGEKEVRYGPCLNFGRF